MDNAYQSPPAYGETKPSAGGQAPTGLMILAIFCIILGVMGLMTSCLAGITMVFQDQINEMQMQGQGQGPGADFQKKIVEIQQGQKIPNIVLTALNLIITPMLIIGGIGCLTKKGWARGFLRTTLLLAAIFVFLRGIVGIFMQLSMMGPMQEMAQAQGQGQGQEAFAGIMTASIVVGVVIGLVWALALISFYIWGWFYLNKESVQDYLESN